MKSLLPFFIVPVMLIQACSKEEAPQAQPKRTAEMNYSFYTGIRNVEVEGEIINRGNVYLNGTQIRFLLYDHNGYLIRTYFNDFKVDNYPGEGTYFYTMFSEPGVSEVKAEIWDLW